NQHLDRFKKTMKAERRYAACDPDNRLIAAQLEKGWEAALRRVQAYKERLEVVSESSTVPTTSFVGLSNDLEAAWNAPGTTMRTRQRLVRALIEDIVVDVDGNAGEITW